jgi:hypothetical protein
MHDMVPWSLWARPQNLSHIQYKKLIMETCNLKTNASYMTLEAIFIFFILLQVIPVAVQFKTVFSTKGPWTAVCLWLNLCCCTASKEGCVAYILLQEEKLLFYNYWLPHFSLSSINYDFFLHRILTREVIYNHFFSTVYWSNSMRISNIILIANVQCGWIWCLF